MKKLFVCVPTQGRAERKINESIERMHQLAEIIFVEKLEVHNEWLKQAPASNEHSDIWRIGESIKELSECDYAIFPEEYHDWQDCRILKDLAVGCGIRYTSVHFYSMFPDAYEALQAFCTTRSPIVPETALL